MCKHRDWERELTEPRPPRLFGLVVDPTILEEFSTEHELWAETLEEIAAGLEWGRRKAVLLAWVKTQMRYKLTKIERESIRLYYFRGKTYREAAKVLGVSHGTVSRAARRGIKKLSAEAQKRGLSYANLPKRRRRRLD